MVWLEVHQFGRVLRQESDDALVVVLLQGHVHQPLIEVQFQFQMHHTALQCGADRVDDGTVSGQVACSHDGHVGVQLLLTGHAVENQLVGRCLNRLRCRTELIEEQHPAVFAGWQWRVVQREQLSERCKGCLTMFIEAWQASHVFWGGRGQAMVNHLEIELGSNTVGDGRFAHTRGAGDIRHQASFDDINHQLTQLAWLTAIQVGHVGSLK